MMSLVYAIGALVVLLAIYPAMPVLLSAWRKYRGKRLVTCPETGRPVAVDIDVGHAALSMLLGNPPDLRLSNCTRWPERRDCGQGCLSQIEAAPEDCLVRNLLARWYAGKKCVLCGKALDHLDWLHHRPALMSPERITYEWRDIPPETLPQVLGTYQPICWDCHIAESFRREFPDLVTDRSREPHEQHR